MRRDHEIFTAHIRKTDKADGHTLDLHVEAIEVGLVVFSVDLTLVNAVVRPFHVVNYQSPFPQSLVVADSDP